MKTSRIKYLLVFLIPFSLLLNSCELTQVDQISLEEEIENVNKTCPQMIDEETRLQKVELIHPTKIRYEYVLIHLDRKNVDTTRFKQMLWPGILSAVKLDPGLERFRQNNMYFDYRYLDKQNQIIYTFNVVPKRYQF